MSTTSSTTALTNKSYAGVTFKYNLAQLGVTTQSGMTYLYYTVNDAAKTATIKAANLWTDISKISKDSSVVFLVEGGQYYIYPPAPYRHCQGHPNKTGAVTLTDGTVIERSILAAQAAHHRHRQDLHLRSRQPWSLHSLTKQGVANLYFFTGEFQPTSTYNGYVGERTYSAQFINVTTGEVVDLPVLFSFIYDALPTIPLGSTMSVLRPPMACTIRMTLPLPRASMLTPTPLRMT